MGSPPTILISSCGGPGQPGDAIYNGGVQIYNAMAMLLRSRGYDAYIVTYDGTYTPWLASYAPYISLAQAQDWKNSGRYIKYVTSWLPSTAFIELADRLYYFDNEIYWTERHINILRKLLQTKIQSIATTSQTQRMWYMMTLKKDVPIINIWMDEEYWYPDPTKRQPGRIGYMNEESPKIAEEINCIHQSCNTAGLDVDMHLISGGDEHWAINEMQRCDIYVGLSHGKHPLWGEGGPANHLQAMLAGCTVVAYDTCGNREYLHHGYNGLMARRGDVRTLSDYVVQLLLDPARKERLRKAGTELSLSTFTSCTRWRAVCDFLELENL